MNRDFITIKEAAEILPLKPRRIRQLAQAGKLEAVKFSRDWLVNQESVEAYRVAHPGKDRNETARI